jgi:P-loop containing dynein motor region D4
MQVGERLQRFEREERHLQLHVTPDSVQAIASIDAALARPGGSVLLLGPCGVGRRAALSLVAHSQQMQVYSPPHALGASVRAFRIFLKEVLLSAGAQGRPTLLVVEDHDVTDTGVLAAADSLLASGELPGLFSAEEIDKEMKGSDRDVKDGRSQQSSNDTFVLSVRKVCVPVVLAVAIIEMSFACYTTNDKSLSELHCCETIRTNMHAVP